jgi:hypothetical protein
MLLAVAASRRLTDAQMMSLTGGLLMHADDGAGAPDLSDDRRPWTKEVRVAKTTRTHTHRADVARARRRTRA